MVLVGPDPSISDPSPSLWRIARPADIEVCRFDDGEVLYDDLGATVLLLSPVAGELARLLGSSPEWHTVDGLTRQLLGSEPTEQDLAAVEQQLEGLRNQGVLEQQASEP